MKSKVLKLRNIPYESLLLYKMNIKPTAFLVGVLVVGVVLLFFPDPITTYGIITCTITCFALVAMPDRTLLEVRNNTIIFFNRKDESECTILYYDEIVSWRYVKNRSCDFLIVETIDNETHTSEVYKSKHLINLLNTLLPCKEKRNRRR